MSDGGRQDLKVKVVRKLASNNVTGAHKREIDTVKGWGFASHNKGNVAEVLEELARNPDAPVEKYGGRDVVRLTSMSEAKEYIKDNGGELPWGLKD